MPRPTRILFENAFYHVMNRGAGRRTIFQNDEQRVYFINLLSECVELFDLEIHAYCLMSNHYHLLIRTPSATLSSAMKHLGSHYARRYNRDTKTDGSLFRGRFKAIVIDADDYLIQVSRYIHRNPVEAKIVKLPGEHMWSSMSAYQSPSEAPQWLTTSAILQKSGPSDPANGYRQLVENDQSPSMREFYRSRRIPSVLGSREFRHYVSGLGFPDVDSLSPNVKQMNMTEVETLIAGHFNVSIEQLRQRSPGTSNPGRLLALYLVDKYDRASTQAMAVTYGIKPATLGVMLSRYRARLKSDAVLADQLRVVEDSLLSC